MSRVSCFRPPPTAVDMSLPPASEEERQLASQAQQEFDHINYDACLATLSKLNNTRGPDPKIQHNKAVVEYYKSKSQRTDEFRKALKDVCSKVVDVVPILVTRSLKYLNVSTYLYNSVCLD